MQDCKTFFENLIGLFDSKKDLHLRRHLHTNRCFAIRLPGKGEKLEELSDLKKGISELVTSRHYWGRVVKRTYVIFEQILMKNKKQRIISRKKLLDYNKKLCPQFRIDDNEISILLKLLHQAGVLLYVDEPVLKDTIILDVQWFVNAFKSILAYPVDITQTLDIERSNFFRTGEVSQKEIIAIWDNNQNKGNKYSEHKQELMLVMEKLGLLHVVMCTSETPLWYCVPYMNKKQFDIEQKYMKEFKKSSILIFQFDTKNKLPIFLFYSLVTESLKLGDWEILNATELKQNPKEENFYYVFDEVACFSLRNHYVLLCICNFQIQVQICHPKEEIQKSLLKEVKTTLEDLITKLTYSNSEFEIGYKCKGGKFHDEEDLSVILEELFPLEVKDRSCHFCRVLNAPVLENEIYWVR